jgi:hypothetical protein
MKDVISSIETAVLLVQKATDALIERDEEIACLKLEVASLQKQLEEIGGYLSV